MRSFCDGLDTYVVPENSEKMIPSLIACNKIFPRLQTTALPDLPDSGAVQRVNSSAPALKPRKLGSAIDYKQRKDSSDPDCKQLSSLIQEPNSECARPQCAEPQGFGAVKQQQQEAPAQFFRVLRKREAAVYENVLDVRAEFTALEVLDGDVSLLYGFTPTHHLVTISLAISIILAI